jgi:UDP-N-acetylglucosamine:LPS N-acetylglucosamine transferase
MAVKCPAILIFCGEGGHAEQMRRLIANIQGKHDLPYVALMEGEFTLGDHESHIIYRKSLIPLRSKHSDCLLLYKFFRGISNFFLALFATIGVLWKFKINLVISTGPGLAIPIGIAGRLFKCRVVHLETWCRFSTKSFTGKYMYSIATEFLVQNSSLLKIYPKAKFVGLL